MKLTIKQARQLAGMTQKDVADLLGVHTHTFMKWERDPEEMSIGTARQFCRIVDRGINEIFFNDESNLIRQEASI